MEINKRIMVLRKEIIKNEKNKSYSRNDFAEKLGVTRGVIENIEYNRVEVKDNIINLICLTFNVNKKWLRNGIEPIFNENTEDKNIIDMLKKQGINPTVLEIIENYLQMDDDTRNIFIDYLEQSVNNFKKLNNIIQNKVEKDKANKRVKELTEIPKYTSNNSTDTEFSNELSITKIEDIQELKNIKLYQAPVSAGLGTWLDNDVPYEMLKVDLKTCPQARRCDFALKVRGDSMEPYYYDGDIVYIKEQPAVDNGQIGIFLYNNDSYIKKLSITKDTVYLISFNEKYKPIKINEDSNFKCFGLVL